MALVEIARFDEVREAELAAAFLIDRGIDASITERFQTTVDPIMQRALGIRVMAPAVQAQEARSLLARAEAGEFATPYDDEPEPQADRTTRATGTIMALILAATGGMWGASLPRRLRPVHWAGIVILIMLVIGPIACATAIKTGLLS